MANFLHVLLSMETFYSPSIIFNQISGSCLEVSRSLMLGSCLVMSIFLRQNSGTLTLVVFGEEGKVIYMGNCPSPALPLLRD